MNKPENQQEKPPQEGRFKIYNGKEWVSMDGILEYLDPADQAQVEAFIKGIGSPSQGKLSDLLDRLSPAGGSAFTVYMELAVNGGLPAVQAMYKRETGKSDYSGLRDWLIARRSQP